MILVKSYSSRACGTTVKYTRIAKDIAETSILPNKKIVFLSYIREMLQLSLVLTHAKRLYY